MTHAMVAARAIAHRSNRLLMLAVVALATVFASTTVEAQGAGTRWAACNDRAWSDLHECYMSGSGYWYDVGCRALFYADISGCPFDAMQE